MVSYFLLVVIFFVFFFVFSFWGKLAQRSNMKKIVITTDEAEFFRKLANPTLKIADWHILNDDMVQLEFENVEEFVPTNMQTNVILASFTTAHARLRLYDVLQHLGQSVLYFDTDSVIYKTDENQDTIKTGDYLGELTDELQGHHIVEFVSAGPKNYSFKLDNGETKCTIKGFTLNHEISKELNFEKMKEEVFAWYLHGGTTNTCALYPNQIRRDLLKQKIYNKFYQ